MTQPRHADVGNRTMVSTTVLRAGDAHVARSRAHDPEAADALEVPQTRFLADFPRTLGGLAPIPPQPRNNRIPCNNKGFRVVELRGFEDLNP